MRNIETKRSDHRADKLFETANRQAGYFTAAQAVEAGYGYPLQHYHRERGHWISAGHGIFRLRRYPEVEDEELVRISLWSRNKRGVPQAVVSHETALRLHGLSDVMPECVHISVPAGFRKQPPKGMVLRKAELGEVDVEDRGGYRTTTPLRTILDIARDVRVSPEHLGAAVSEALERGLVRRKWLTAALGSVEDEARRSIVQREIPGASP